VPQDSLSGDRYKDERAPRERRSRGSSKAKPEARSEPKPRAEKAAAVAKPRAEAGTKPERKSEARPTPKAEPRAAAPRPERSVKPRRNDRHPQRDVGDAPDSRGFHEGNMPAFLMRSVKAG